MPTSATIGVTTAADVTTTSQPALPSSTSGIIVPPQPAPSTTAAPSISSGIAVDAPPTAIATGAHRLWLASADEITALDPRTGTATAHVPVTGTVAMTIGTNVATISTDPPRLAACSTNQTVEIGTVSNAISATYPWGCTGIAVGAGALWIVRDVQLVELGPQGDLVSTVDVDDGLGVAATNDAIWVIEGGSGHPQLRQMSPGFHTTIATYPLDATPETVIANDAGVWVSVRSDDGIETLVGFGTPAQPQVRTYPPGSGGTGMDFSGRFLWVANAAGGVSVVDTNNGELVDVPSLRTKGEAKSAVRLVAANGALFVTGREPNSVERLLPGSFGDSVQWGEAPTPIRIEVAAGCPASIASTASILTGVPFANPDPTGLTETLVPGRPTTAIICRYTDVEASMSALGSTAYVGGALSGHAALDASAAIELATTINAAIASDYIPSCTADLDGAEYTAIAFAMPDRPDIDVWYEDYAGCPSLSNGRRVVSPLINGAGTDVIRLLEGDLA